MRRGLLVFRSATCLILIGLCCFLSYHGAHFWYRGSVRLDSPPEAFQEEELLGAWKADYRRYDLCGHREARSLVEWLVLREDKTFYQVLQDRRGQIPEQWAQGTWWVERFPDGATHLHLEKGRFFAEEVCELFPHLSPLSYFRGCSPVQTGHELTINLQEEAALFVGWDRFTKELYLAYPFVSEDPPIIVEFGRVSESELVPIPTPGP